MKNLLRVYLVIFLITMAKGTMNVIFPPFLETRAYPISQIGLLSSLFAVFQLISRMPSGAYYTSGRARFSLSVGLLSLGLSALGIVAFHQTIILVVMIILNGYAFGAITTIALALCIDAKPADYSSGAMMGWYTSAIAAGYAVGQPIGGYLVDASGYPAAFTGTAVFSLLAILFIVSLTGWDAADAQKPVKSKPHGADWWRQFDLRKMPGGVLLATVIVFFANLMFRSLHTFFPLYALAVGLSLTQIGLLRSVLATAAAVVRPFSGGVFRLIHHRNVTHIAMIAGAAAVILSPTLIGSMGSLIFLFAFMGISRGMLRVTSATFVAESTERMDGGQVGVWSGVYNAGLDLGSIAGPAVGGFLAEMVGIPKMLTVIPIVTLSLYAVVSLLEQHKRKDALTLSPESEPY